LLLERPNRQLVTPGTPPRSFYIPTNPGGSNKGYAPGREPGTVYVLPGTPETRAPIPRGESGVPPGGLQPGQRIINFGGPYPGLAGVVHVVEQLINAVVQTANAAPGGVTPRGAVPAPALPNANPGLFVPRPTGPYRSGLLIIPQVPGKSHTDLGVDP